MYCLCIHIRIYFRLRMIMAIIWKSAFKKNETIQNLSCLFAKAENTRIIKKET